MPVYPGRVSPAPSIRNFGGVDYTASDLNVNPNGARESINWDLTTQGSIRLRKGWKQLCDHTNEGKLDGVFIFISDGGGETQFTISNGKVFAISGGVKTQITGTFTITPGLRWRGAQWQGKIWLTNGVDQPIVIIPGSPNAVKTMTQVSIDENTSSKLPAEWGANPPRGFIVVNRGQDERMFAWSLYKVYFSGLGTATDWLVTGVDGAGAFVVGAADGDVIQAVVSKFGYIVVFTNQRTLIYTGDGPGDATTPGIVLSHILFTGCPGGPDSIIQASSDTYFWSEFGPASLLRILNTTELSSDLVGLPVQPHAVEQTNRNLWTSIVGYHDIKNTRIIWWAPLLGSTSLDTAYVYQYDIKAWYRYEGVRIECAAASPRGGVYAGIASLSSHWLGELHDGFVDGAADIEGRYLTMPYFWGQPDMTKTVPFVDVFFKNATAILDMNYFFDWDSISGSERLALFESGDEWGTSEADLNPLVLRWGPGLDNTVFTWGTDPTVKIQRVDVYGMGKFFAVEFVAKGHNEVEILGWKVDPRMKGLR